MSKKYRLIASATMGLESVVKDECKDLLKHLTEELNLMEMKKTL